MAVPNIFLVAEFEVGFDVELCPGVKDPNEFAPMPVGFVFCAELCPRFDGAKRLDPCSLF